MSATVGHRPTRDGEVGSLPPNGRSDGRRPKVFTTSRWRWLLLGLLVLVIGFALWVLFFTTAFAVRSVEVEGNRQVSTEDVLAAAAVPSDVPFIKVPLDAVAGRVEELDAVARVSVERQWPNTIRLVVTERRAVAQVETATGYGLLGSDGLLFRTEQNPVRALPMLASSWPDGAQDLSNGSVGELTATEFEVARSLSRGIRRQVEMIDATDDQNVTLTLANGATVRWGSAASGGRKSEVLGALLSRRATQYDVSVPDAPAWSG